LTNELGAQATELTDPVRLLETIEQDGPDRCLDLDARGSSDPRPGPTPWSPLRYFQGSLRSLRRLNL